MKKRGILWVGCIISFLLIIGITSYHQNKLVVQNKEVQAQEKTAKINIYVPIKKLDESSQPLSGVEFELSSYNHIFEYTSTEVNYSNNGFNYNLSEEDSTISFAEAYNVLSKEQKNAVERVYTFQDLVDVFGPADCAVGIRNQLAVRNCYVILPTIFYLEESIVPTGYAKDKKIITGNIELKFEVPGYSATSDPVTGEETVNDSTYSLPVELSNITIGTACPGEYIDYGLVEEESLVTAEALLNTTSGIATGEVEKGNAVDTSCALVLSNQKGKLQLEVISYVNNTKSITTKINQNIDFKVTVSNTGTADAIDTTIKSRLPEGFIYIDGTATRKGKYADGYIEWNVPRIEQGETIDLFYEAFAPRESSTGMDYTSEAILSNFALDENIVSNKTMVRLSLNNPNTQAPISLIGAILYFAVGVFLLGLRSYQKRRAE